MCVDCYVANNHVFMHCKLHSSRASFITFVGWNCCFYYTWRLMSTWWWWCFLIATGVNLIFILPWYSCEARWCIIPSLKNKISDCYCFMIRSNVLSNTFNWCRFRMTYKTRTLCHILSVDLHCVDGCCYIEISSCSLVVDCSCLLITVALTCHRPNVT